MHGVTPCRLGGMNGKRGKSGPGKFSPGWASAWRGTNPAFIGQPSDLIPFLFAEDEDACSCWKALVS